MSRHRTGYITIPVPVLLFALVIISAGAPAALGAAILGEPQQPAQGAGTIIMRWSYPETATPSLVTWHRRHAAGLAAVEHAWGRLLRRLGGQLPARFTAQCESLAERLGHLDEGTLLPAPDRLLDLYLKRMLWHLQQAGHRCRPDQLWNVVYHLEEARGALGEVRWILERHGLEPQQHDDSAQGRPGEQP